MGKNDPGTTDQGTLDLGTLGPTDTHITKAGLRLRLRNALKAKIGGPEFQCLEPYEITKLTIEAIRDLEIQAWTWHDAALQRRQSSHATYFQDSLGIELIRGKAWKSTIS